MLFSQKLNYVLIHRIQGNDGRTGADRGRELSQGCLCLGFGRGWLLLGLVLRERLRELCDALAVSFHVSAGFVGDLSSS